MNELFLSITILTTWTHYSCTVVPFSWKKVIKQNRTVRKKQTFFVKSWKKVKVQFEIYFLEEFSLNSKKRKNIYINLSLIGYQWPAIIAVRLFVGHRYDCRSVRINLRKFEIYWSTGKTICWMKESNFRVTKINVSFWLENRTSIICTKFYKLVEIFTNSTIKTSCSRILINRLINVK